MIKILSGEMAIELHLQFLIRNNNTDLMILKNTKVNVSCNVVEMESISTIYRACYTVNKQKNTLSIGGELVLLVWRFPQIRNEQ